MKDKKRIEILLRVIDRTFRRCLFFDTGILRYYATFPF